MELDVGDEEKSSFGDTQGLLGSDLLQIRRAGYHSRMRGSYVLAIVNAIALLLNGILFLTIFSLWHSYIGDASVRSRTHGPSAFLL